MKRLKEKTDIWGKGLVIHANLSDLLRLFLGELDHHNTVYPWTLIAI